MSNAIAAALDSGDPAQVYRRYAGPVFTSHNTEAAFVEQLGYFRIQLGGPARARANVGSQALTRDFSGQPADLYYVRYLVRYPAAQVFQDIYMERVNGEWKLYGFWFIPAPTD
ncbi:MAG: DUF4019 domain-containing protein [Sphingomonadaceae bacterium]|nr:DUF4019 domain-containing protein [Sphingomonadaceae bacterium]